MGPKNIALSILALCSSLVPSAITNCMSWRPRSPHTVRSQGPSNFCKHPPILGVDRASREGERRPLLIKRSCRLGQRCHDWVHRAHHADGTRLPRPLVCGDPLRSRIAVHLQRWPGRSPNATATRRVPSSSATRPVLLSVSRTRFDAAEVPKPNCRASSQSTRSLV